MRIIIICILFVLLAGCSIKSSLGQRSLSSEDLALRIKQSPIVEYFEEYRSNKQREYYEIEIHYKLFHPLNSPDVYKNWEYHYIIGEYSAPEWDYKKFADISIYQTVIDDEMAMSRMQKKISEIGGAAAIDVFRKPLYVPDADDRKYKDSTYSIPIFGYLYYGVVVMEKIQN